MPDFLTPDQVTYITERADGIGYLQADMLRHVIAFGGGQCSIARDRDSQRVATSLEQRGLIGVNRDFQYWMVWLIMP